MIQTIPPTGLWGQTLCILALGLGVGWGARALQAPDFTLVTEAAPTADTSEVKALAEGAAPSPDAGVADTLKSVSFEDIFSELLDKENVSFIDARDRGSYLAGRLPGAIHLDAEAVEADRSLVSTALEGVSMSQVLVVYCSGGNCDLSRRLGIILQEGGRGPVLLYEGGYQDWLEFEGPVEEGEVSP